MFNTSTFHLTVSDLGDESFGLDPDRGPGFYPAGSTTNAPSIVVGVPSHIEPTAASLRQIYSDTFGTPCPI